MVAKGDTPIKATGKVEATLWRFIYLMSVTCVGGGRPLLKDLYDRVVYNVADKWRNLGVQLLRPDLEKMLDLIAADHPHDVVRCCICVLTKWLDTTTDATWNELIRALRSPSVQLDYLAGQLEQMLITEHNNGKTVCILIFSYIMLFGD